ncbi:MAG: ribose-5-phosphate isomerase RpiA [Candidatus Micrarchaeota archaeon]
MADFEKQKAGCARKALDYVEDGMVLGLGTGTTAEYFVKFLAESSLDVKCVCTSQRTKKLAASLGLKVFSLDEIEHIDLAIDGADVVASDKHLIKGYGGALTREKIIEYTAEKFIVIVDSSKMSGKLARPVPVEYLPFAKRMVEAGLRKLGAKKLVQRMDGDGHFSSDNNFYIVDADFGEISNPALLERQINEIPGVLENGIFSRPVFKVIIGEESGVREI